MKSDPERGLSAGEAAARLEQYGRNELQEGARRTLPQIILDQFKDVTVWVLLAATAVSAFLHEVTDAIVIVAIVVLNAVLGVVQESKAEQSLQALRKMAAPHSRVVRDGHPVDVSSTEIVPGDVVLLEAGQWVPADVRLLEAHGLRVDEASLTGESVPSEKKADAQLPADTALGDRVTAAFSGTTIVTGRGRGLVTGTGSSTEIGNIATLLGQVESEATPLQQRLESLGRTLAVLVLGISVVVFFAGWLRGHHPQDMLLTSISLAVAAIPEGLPAVVTIVLALGMTRMVRRNALIRRLRAVEALGSVTIICSDKTGTLTQNRMTVVRLRAGGRDAEVQGSGPETRFKGLEPTDPVVRQLLEVATLCNDAHLREKDGKWEATGDPTETALLVAAAAGGVWREALEKEQPRRGEAAFDSDRKRMATVHALPNGRWRVLVKGAPDAVLAVSSHAMRPEGPQPLTPELRQRGEEANARFSGEALRVLGFASKELDQEPADLSPEALEKDLTFLGMLGMIDPPREEAKEAVRTCLDAGIRPVMITGDHAVTARAIAGELAIWREGDLVLTGDELNALSDDQLREKLDQVRVYARVSPKDKLRIVEQYLGQGHVVAMTGDGVNDAPALKKASIGVAMGITGTDVAKGAADVVLTDDNFASIVSAVEEGRRIFDNIRKFVFYLLSCNISEVFTLFLAIVAGLPQPLLAVQILWVNLVTDGLPALALGLEPQEPGIMKRPPQDPEARVLDRTMLKEVSFYGACITVATLAAYAHGLYWDCLVPMGHTGMEALRFALQPDFWQEAELKKPLELARTMAFGTLAFSQLTHAINCRSEHLSLFKIGLFTNPRLLAAIAFSAVAQLLVIYTPWGNHIFQTQPVKGTDLAVCVVLSLLPLLLGEGWKALQRRTPSTPAPAPPRRATA